MSVSLFNSTPFHLEIEVCERGGGVKARFHLNPVKDRSLLIQNETMQLERPLLRIKANDSLGKTLKSVEFYTQCNHSWIISDSEVRRQLSDSQLHVSDCYSEKEKESYYCWDPDYKWKYCREIKQYSWDAVGGIPCLCIGAVDTCHPAFKMVVKTEALATHRSGDSAANKKTINIFNDSPYYLDISMEDRSSHRLYWNDPESNRVTPLQTNDAYPLIKITACDSIGQQVKSASFYTRNDFSWVVTDECIVRQKPGAAPYAALPYEASQIISECSRDRCDEAMRYNWLIDTDKDLTLRRMDEPGDSSLTMGSAEEQRVTEDHEPGGVFFDMAHPSGFSSMTAKESKAAHELVEWITFDRLCRGKAGTLYEESNFRLDLQRIQSEPRPYTVFAIQSGNRHFATVYIHNDLINGGKIANGVLRKAFTMSLLDGKEIWISVDSAGDKPPTGPPVGDAKMQFKLVLSIKDVGNNRVRIWRRDDRK